MIKKHHLLSIFFVLVLFSFLQNAWASLEEIKTAVLQEDFEKVKTLSQDALASQSLGQEQEEVRYYLALSQLYTGEHNTARGNFQMIADGTKNMDLYDQACIGVISSYYLAGHYRESLKRAHQLLAQRPDSNYLSLVYLKIARANLKLQHWDPARRFLKKIMNDFPDSLEAYTAKQLLEEKQFFTVQVGAFLNRETALSLVDELQLKGQYGYIVQTQDKKGNTFYRVRVGEVSSLGAANKLKENLSTLGYPTLIYP
jgi:tetratricopeptide (TPR) repeat protein